MTTLIPPTTPTVGNAQIIARKFLQTGVDMAKRIVAVNERGIRIGEDHPRAKLTDHEVELIRQMHESGLSYRKIAEKFEISHGQAWFICTCRKRAQTASNWKTV